jgi:hypothetical protein
LNTVTVDRVDEGDSAFRRRAWAIKISAISHQQNAAADQAIKIRFIGAPTLHWPGLRRQRLF